MSESPPYRLSSKGSDYDWEMDLVLACGQVILAQISQEPMTAPGFRIIHLFQTHPVWIAHLAGVEPGRLSAVGTAQQPEPRWRELRSLTGAVLRGFDGASSGFLRAARVEGAGVAAIALFAAHAADQILEGESHFFALRNLFAFLGLPPGSWAMTAMELLALSGRPEPPFLADSVRPGNTVLDLNFRLPEGAEVLFGLQQVPPEVLSSLPEPAPPVRPRPSWTREGKPPAPAPAKAPKEEESPVCTFEESASLPGLSSLVVAPEVMEELRYALALCARAMRRDETCAPPGPSCPAPRLLFHGPPGTGKTHAARALAHDLGRPLALVLPGALMQKWVGETEKAIERAFREAADQGALLFLDEADSFLHDRRRALQSHELSCVNALLNQLERPPVPVILCTNLLDSLDPAVHRRIDHMLEFPVPGLAQRRILWEKELVRAQLWRCRPDYDRLAELPLSGGLIHSAVTQAARRRLVNGDAYTVDTGSLLALAQKELPKMGDLVQTHEPIGFKAQAQKEETAPKAVEQRKLFEREVG